METRLILRGLLCGGIAGVLAFVFGRIFAEPLVQQAISYEDQRNAAEAALTGTHGHAEAEVFSRTIQANLGLGAGIILFGAALGAIFAVIYICSVGRTGNLGPRGLSLAVAGLCFLGFYLVPFLKYPANPPAVGNHDTIRTRGTLYLIMVVASLAFLALAVWLGQKLKPRFGTWSATILAGTGFVVAIGIVMVLLPNLGELAVNQKLTPGATSEVPGPLLDASGTIVFPGFPAEVLAGFRLYSVGAQLLLWGALGVLFAPLAERVLTPAPSSATPEPAAVA